MNINFGKIKEKIKPGDLFKKIAGFIISKSSWFLLFFLLVLFGYCIYMWYIFVYNTAWSEERKQEYIKKKESETSLNKEKFNDILSEMEQRKGRYGKKTESAEDIFRLKQN